MGNVKVALATLRAIDETVAADGGASFRGWLGKVIPHIGDAYRTEKETFRTHLGASLLGGECERAIWYGFRWTTVGDFGGRILRLFNRGHLEEARFISMLLMIGCQIYQQDANGKQFRISFAEGHAGGSGDGIAVGVPDLAPGVPALSEFKTHSEKSFIELSGPLADWRKYLAGDGKFTGKGLKEAKFEHYVQMQLYMRKMELTFGLYVAVNKNTDDLYAEIITLDTLLADMYLARGERTVWAKTPPEKLNPSPGFWKCRFCDHKQLCHLDGVPAKNCRTCRFADPVPGGNGLWECTNEVCLGMIPKELQLTGCSHYERSRVI
jgi:hypothetical protein